MNHSSGPVVQKSGSLTAAMPGEGNWVPVDVNSIAGRDITLVGEFRVTT